MAERYQHLELQRVELSNERRRRRGRGPGAPSDPVAHARRLAEELEARLREEAESEIPGFDARHLLKLPIEGIQAGDLEAIPGVALVSQEGKTLTLLFATDEAIEEVRARLAAVAAGRTVTRKELLWAIQRVERVTREDRFGPTLRAMGVPAAEPFTLDAELWPLERSDERDGMLRSFIAWAGGEGIEVLDTLNNAAVVLARVRATGAGLERLLNKRDVRQVDLPPRYQLNMSLLQVGVAQLPAVAPPTTTSPRVGVLDSGLATGHPLLAPAVGDAQGFGDNGAEDVSGHGTHVAGIVLLGDVEAVVGERSIAPELWILSGKIYDENDDAELVENRVAKAVAYFVEQYGCRVFALAFGDPQRPYRSGGHVGRFAAMLDALARQHGVLFVVSAGNFEGSGGVPQDWRVEYPEYLLTDEARIIDPAPALNVLTVGSLGRHEVARMAERFPNDPAYQPLARFEEPSPFTRSGLGPLNAIKPELVAFGGNEYVELRGGQVRLSPGRELGEVSTSHEFLRGNLLSADLGTSQAAARVTNITGKVLAEYPQASANLLRALLVAHAEVPAATQARLGGDEAKVLRLVGYGRPAEEASRYSSERRVTLVSEEVIAPNQHHFYEILLPDDFYGVPARRPRRLRVALSHMPRVRRTRLEYKEQALSFRVVRARTLEEVATAYRRVTPGQNAEPSIPEATGFRPGPNARAGGTVQATTREMLVVRDETREKGYFVVVTSSVPAWATSPEAEPYALVVVIEDLSEVEVQLYSQIRVQLQARARVQS